MGPPAHLWWPPTGGHCLVRRLLHPSAYSELAPAQVRNTVRITSLSVSDSLISNPPFPVHLKRHRAIPLSWREGVRLDRIARSGPAFTRAHIISLTRRINTAHCSHAATNAVLWLSRPLMHSGSARMTTSLVRSGVLAASRCDDAACSRPLQRASSSCRSSCTSFIHSNLASLLTTFIVCPAARALNPPGVPDSLRTQNRGLLNGSLNQRHYANAWSDGRWHPHSSWAHGRS